MTPAARMIRTVVDKLFGKYYESESPPERFEKIVKGFVDFHPKATKGEWCEFAKELAAEAYRDGYKNGYERSYRVPDDALPAMPPELTADNMDPEWRNSVPFREEFSGALVDEQEIPADPLVPEAEEDE